MQSLPLFYYPTTWLWVDDDPILMNTMVGAFPATQKIRTFSSASDCLAFLKSYASATMAHALLSDADEDETASSPHQSPLKLDLKKVMALAQNTDRLNDVSLMITDFQMPEIDGLMLAEKTQTIPIQKILLTGNGKEEDAVRGFNQNTIHRFVKKSSDTMHAELKKHAQILSHYYFSQLTKPLLTCLEAEGASPLSDPVFIDTFQTYCLQNHITEYYLIDKNGSFLCIDNQGKYSYFVVHTAKSLLEWRSIYGNELSDEIKSACGAEKMIPFFGAGKEAWEIPVAEWSKHFYPAAILEGREKYLYAIVMDGGIEWR
ncbi:MAG: hypothetical protein A3E84_04665 [Gammaproteobacteria bacterium RIFCSPHIGHO2_12_FULL_42_13]|nr:MAG: hypothetical protein A3E84_04665 [Gammaproteobacteria bacterium RIFCSPHIGHO2_12_FULL_42_13]